MKRRPMFLGLGACAVAQAAGAAPLLPAGDAVAFQVLRNGSPIGEHHMTFAMSGETLTATTTVALKVTMAGMTLFNYALRAEERWQSDAFQTLDSVANFDGDPCEVHVEPATGGYAVRGMNHDNPAKNTARYIAPPDTLPATYWNKRLVGGGTVLNIQTAHSYRLAVASPGWNNLPTADGGSIVARRYDLSGKINVSVWYDKDDAWAGLAFQKNGAITYRKMTV